MRTGTNPSPSSDIGILLESLSLSFPNSKMGSTSQGYESSEEKFGNFLSSDSSRVRGSSSTSPIPPEPCEAEKARGLADQEVLDVNPSFAIYSLSHPGQVPLPPCTSFTKWGDNRPWQGCSSHGLGELPQARACLEQSACKHLFLLFALCLSQDRYPLCLTDQPLTSSVQWRG